MKQRIMNKRTIEFLVEPCVCRRLLPCPVLVPKERPSIAAAAAANTRFRPKLHRSSSANGRAFSTPAHRIGSSSMTVRPWAFNPASARSNSSYNRLVIQQKANRSSCQPNRCSATGLTLPFNRMHLSNPSDSAASASASASIPRSGVASQSIATRLFRPFSSISLQQLRVHPDGKSVLLLSVFTVMSARKNNLHFQKASHSSSQITNRL
ncbi:hypothetical protein WR25_03537 [Diploscapter pachys]|uniref:Uncharacterized protein n=1 Tax=Diploscapter pachys TaxID=2018661 RepID=A0A2A2K4I9_9BILA|nr:hypothetical protein WR25_03537 [Diploscapter pachys]